MNGNNTKTDKEILEFEIECVTGNRYLTSQEKELKIRELNELIKKSNK